MFGSTAHFIFRFECELAITFHLKSLNKQQPTNQQTKPSSKCIRVFRMNQFHERHAIYLAFIRWQRSNELGSVIQSTKSVPRLYNYFMLFFSAVDFFFFPMTIKRGNRLFMEYEKWKEANHERNKKKMQSSTCTTRRSIMS